jgi:tetratricopeptide (TPR) repeat protein
MSRALPVKLLLPIFAAFAAASSWAEEVKDPWFGEALFYAHQGEWFEALDRLDTEVGQHIAVDEPNLDSLYVHFNDAEFSLGDFELRYRMHHRAGRAIKAVLEGSVDEVIRNDAAYRLARIHFQKGQMEDAMLALDRIEGEIPRGIRDDINFLRANIYLATDRRLQPRHRLPAGWPPHGGRCPAGACRPDRDGRPGRAGDPRQGQPRAGYRLSRGRRVRAGSALPESRQA